MNCPWLCRQRHRREDQRHRAAGQRYLPATDCRAPDAPDRVQRLRLHPHAISYKTSLESCCGGDCDRIVCGRYQRIPTIRHVKVDWHLRLVAPKSLVALQLSLARTSTVILDLCHTAAFNRRE